MGVVGGQGTGDPFKYLPVNHPVKSKTLALPILSLFLGLLGELSPSRLLGLSTGGLYSGISAIWGKRCTLPHQMSLHNAGRHY